MSQATDLLDMFIAHGHKLTLGQILQSPIGYEWRARATELRKKGFTITLERGKTPSMNTYRLVPPDGAQMRWI